MRQQISQRIGTGLSDTPGADRAAGLSDNPLAYLLADLLPTIVALSGSTNVMLNEVKHLTSTARRK
jgi:hypothetical protein